jgi:hypothetical protein
MKSLLVAASLLAAVVGMAGQARADNGSKLSYVCSVLYNPPGTSTRTTQVGGLYKTVDQGDFGSISVSLDPTGACAGGNEQILSICSTNASDGLYCDTSASVPEAGLHTLLQVLQQAMYTGKRVATYSANSYPWLIRRIYLTN